MKFFAFIFGLSFFMGRNFQSGPAFQEIPQFQKPIQHEVSVVNIEIPVGVFKGDTFVDSDD